MNGYKVRSIPSISITPGQPANYYQAAKDYREFESDYGKHKAEMSFLFGQHLKLAGALLKQKDPEIQRSGLGLVWQVILFSGTFLKDYEFAARVADAYVIPNLSLADDNPFSVLSEYYLLSSIVNAYTRAERPDMVERIAGRAIELRPFGRNQTDAWRVKLALALLDQGRVDDGIAVLQDIQDPSMTPLRDFHLPKFQEAKKNLESSTTIDNSNRGPMR